MKQIFLLNLIIFPTCFANQKNTRREKSTDKPWEKFYTHILNLAYISWNSLSFFVHSLFLLISFPSAVKHLFPSLDIYPRKTSFCLHYWQWSQPLPPFPFSHFPHSFLLLISLLASRSTHTYVHMHAHMYSLMHTKAGTSSVVCLILICTRISSSITFIHWKHPDIISLYCAMYVHHGVFLLLC